MIWGKHAFLHMAIATDNCNVIGRHHFLAQNLEAKIVSLVSCALSRSPPRFFLSLYSRRLVQYGVRKHCSYRSALLFHRCDRLIWECIRLQWSQEVGSKGVCKTRWLSSEETVTARCNILAIWAALKQLLENKNDAMCVFFTATS